MITLYQYEISPFCDKVRRVLKYKGLEYKIEEISLLDTISGRLKKISDTGKVPSIEVDGRRITDSTEIAHYLEAHYPTPPLIPEDKREQALVHVFEDWADEALYFYEMQLRFIVKENAQKWIPKVAKNDPDFVKWIAPLAVPAAMAKVTKAQGVGRKSITTIKSELDTHFNSLNNWLENSEWLVGDKITLADISVFVQLYCLVGTEEGKAIMEQYPRVQDWMNRVSEATE
ncbi:glutathione S-transferase [Oleiphilus messinensis]|uniref:Glutathione S-transferase n=1 Tax=Oleiphilus messinensis TaxID=141451 RepID=A0A1Y0IAW2_9GAMM|nr:glutathione S-transferase family protein [Oleiphilus messinensis]ARU56896.1 glutathione S-transferase [Oleiphilus messinensis]